MKEATATDGKILYFSMLKNKVSRYQMCLPLEKSFKHPKRLFSPFLVLFLVKMQFRVLLGAIFKNRQIGAFLRLVPWRNDPQKLKILIF